MTNAPNILMNLRVPGFKYFQPLIYEASELPPSRRVLKRLWDGKMPSVEYGKVMQAASGGKQILLEGPPGSGKSTVSRQLCKDWAIGVLGAEFELVVLVPLRELKKAAKLKDLLKVAYWNMPQGVVHYIEAMDGRRVLFILDGYDEIKSQIGEVPTVIKKILHRSYLQLSSMIITSRGIAGKELYERQLFHNHFEIVGMRKEEIPNFVSHYFGSREDNVTKAQTLLDKLDADPSLTAACSNTLALAIVCYLHSECENIPTTTTGLYGQFLVISLKEFANRSPEPVELPRFMLKYNKEMFLRDLTSILQPGSPFSYLHGVAKMALEGILQDKYIFETNDGLVPEFPEGFDGYGLLDCTVLTDEFGLDTKLYRLNFLHLTLQEFMAALSVASWAPEEQADFWKSHLAMQYKGYSSVADKDSFLTMFTFYCGLTGLQNKGVQDHFLSEMNGLWTPSSQLSKALVQTCNVVAESGNKEIACPLLSTLGRKAEVDVANPLARTNMAWCLTVCKGSYD